MSDNRTSLRDCLDEVIRIANDVTNSQDTNIPSLLLSLADVLEKRGLDSSGVREVKRQIWRCDLVHVIIEVLRQDFSLVQGQWNTATQLASILISICAGFHPGTSSKAGLNCPSMKANAGVTSNDQEQVQEYYEILLPTATDSVLILANNLLELESVDTAVVADGSHLEYIHSTLESLTWLCTSHKQCMLRALQSPYLLHMLINDTSHLCQAVLSTVTRLIKFDPTVISSLPEDIIHSILDELVYKVSGNEKQLGELSLKLVSGFVKGCPGLVGLISSRYFGLLTVVSKWKDQCTDSDIKEFIGHLEAKSEVDSKGERVSHAAVLIQATWRGYSTRAKLKRMHQSIRRFQKLYRKRQAEKTRLKEQEIATRGLQESRMVALQSNLHDFHKKQMRMVEQLPASKIDKFVCEQKDEATTKIQTWWRRRIAQVKHKEKQEVERRTAGALVLQRSFRRLLDSKRQSNPDNTALAMLFPPISPTEREVFQKEITCQREHHPVHLSELQSKQLHEEAQKLLQDFYCTRPAAHCNKKKGVLLLSKLTRDCELLLGAPDLESLTPSVIDNFTSRSVSIAQMAQNAHQEELKTLDVPWWKQPPVNSKPVSLLD